MKALSIMQPWAWLIVAGHKDIENRNWKPTNPGLRFRGPVLIHCGKTFDGDDDPAEWAWPHIDRPEDFDMGGIVGEVEIVDCVTRSSSRWFCGPYGFVIRNARAAVSTVRRRIGLLRARLHEDLCRQSQARTRGQNQAAVAASRADLKPQEEST